MWVLIPILMMYQPSICIDGVSGGSLFVRGEGGTGCEIAVAIDGERVSPWVPYPAEFNPAKTSCVFSEEDGTLEVTSQMPYTADYTRAVYSTDGEWNLTLLEQGDVDYYGMITAEIEALLDQGDIREAGFRAMEIMYPGSMPHPEKLCAMFVVNAGLIGSPDAFTIASDVTYNLMGIPIYEIPCETPEFIYALRVYAAAADSVTADAVLERTGTHE